MKTKCYTIEFTESARFAVVDIEEFNMVKELFSDTQKLEDYLDYLHLQKIKKQSTKRYTMDEVCKVIES